MTYFPLGNSIFAKAAMPHEFVFGLESCYLLVGFISACGRTMQLGHILIK